MRRITQPIREYHQNQYPWIDKCSDVADQAGDLPLKSLLSDIDALIQWMRKDILPDLDVEDRILYPTISVIMGAPQATNTMRVDHTEFRNMTCELEILRSELEAGKPLEQLRRLRSLLYSLHTLLRLHFQKEEQVYLAIIDDHLTSEQGKRLLEAMDQEQRQQNRKGCGASTHTRVKHR
jgi:iron-sulfur cluster repair protein YtfE (RIC family)